MPGFQNPGLGRKQVVPWRESRWAEKSQVAGPGQLFLALAHSSNPELAVQNVTHGRSRPGSTGQKFQGGTQQCVLAPARPHSEWESKRRQGDVSTPHLSGPGLAETDQGFLIWFPSWLLPGRYKCRLFNAHR